MREAADVVHDVGARRGALPDARPADGRVRAAPAVRLRDGLRAPAGRAARVEHDRDVLGVDGRERGEVGREWERCGRDEREGREGDARDERGEVRVVQQRLAAALGEEVAHDGLARQRELEAEQLGGKARARESVELHEIRDVLARQPARTKSDA